VIAGRYPANINVSTATLHPPELRECLQECRDEKLSFPVAFWISHQHADAPHPLALLRARRQRQRGCCAADQRDELAPFHHSITSSARASSEVGTSRPSALAVFRLIASSNFVAACTGRSAGFSPLRMRST